MRHSYFTLLIIFLLLLQCLLWTPFVSASDFLLRREEIKRDIETGKIGIYDISFTTYVSLGMWDEIDSILEANNRNVLKYTLPDQPNSRPFYVNGEIWVFPEDGSKGLDGIHVFEASSLQLKKILRNDLFRQYRGGIRAVIGDMVIVNGTGRDMETAAVWNIQTDEIHTLRLPVGYFIGTVAVKDDLFYIGACGENEQVLQYDSNLEFIKSYSIEALDSEDKRAKQGECILGIAVVGDRLVGIGDTHIIHWNIETGELLDITKNHIHNPTVCLKKFQAVEFRGKHFSVMNLKNGDLRNRTIRFPILDVEITSDQILAKQKGDLLVIALQHDQGFLFYDLENAERLAHIFVNSGPFTVRDGKIFVTEGRTVYQYDFRQMEPTRYQDFLKSIRIDKMTLTDGVYFQLLKRARMYPHAIPLDVLSERFFASRKISIRHCIELASDNLEGKSPEYLETPSTKTDSSRYVVSYEITNESSRSFSITLLFQWENRESLGSFAPNEDFGEVAWERVLLPANGGKVVGQVPVFGEKPEKVYIFPTRIEELVETADG